MRIAVFTSLLFLATSAFAGELFSFLPWGRADGKEFNFKVTDADVSNTPVWYPNALNPPLDPRRAGEIARKQLEQLVADVAKWRLRKISLRNAGSDHWVYVVEFDRHPADMAIGSASFFIPVLMNGAVLNPEIKYLAPLAPLND